MGEPRIQPLQSGATIKGLEKDVALLAGDLPGPYEIIAYDAGLCP